MELLQSLLNNPLNLDLISYPCSERGFLAWDPGITSAQSGAQSECAVPGGWAPGLLSSSHKSSSSGVLHGAKRAQLFTSRYVIPAAAN